MIVGGANPVSSVSTCAPTAWPEDFSSPIAWCTISKQSTGSSTPTGSGAYIVATRLPSAPRSVSARIETGTMALQLHVRRWARRGDAGSVPGPA